MSLAKKGKGTSAGGKYRRKPLKQYSDDEIDAFQASREKICLEEGEQGDDYANFSDLDEETVLDLPSTEDDDDDDGGGEYDDADSVEEEGDDDESDSEGGYDEKGDEQGDETWGRSRKTFYSADVDPEDLKDEAKEAKRLQKRQICSLAAKDFGISGRPKGTLKAGPVSLELSDSEGSGDGLDSSDRYASESDFLNLDGEGLEELLPEEEKLNLIQRHAPEVKNFLKEFKRQAEEVKNVIEPALLKLKSSNTEKGLSFLETKYQMLIGYCANLAYYLLLKVQGKSTDKHPVVERLVKYRLLIEKIKPLEAKLQYQVDKLIQAASVGSVDLSNAKSKEELSLAYRPNLSLMEASESSGEELDKGSGLYKAPKLAPAHFTERSGKKGDRLEEREKMLASKSRFLADMQAELEDRPEEDSIDPVYGRSVGGRGEAMKHQEEFEEENFVRFTLSKKEQRQLERMQAKPVDELEDLNDFFRDEGRQPTSSAKPGKSTMERILGTKLPKSKAGPSSLGGDDDVPAKRLKYNPKKSQKSTNNDVGSDLSEIEDDVNIGVFEQDDELYKAAKHRSGSRKDSRGGQRSTQYKPIRDAAPGEKRPASYEMIKNRGLTPSRPKEVRNPRVRQRQKWERAQKKIKSFKSVASTPARPYSGESSGIRTNISRSVKF